MIHAELLLGSRFTVDEGSGILADIVEAGAVTSDPDSVWAHGRVVTILDGCGPMAAPESYMWPFSRLVLAETSHLPETEHLRRMLAQPVKKGFEGGFADLTPSGPSSDRVYIGIALAEDEDLESAETYFNDVLLDPEVGPDQKQYHLAELWRLHIWKRYGQLTQDPAERKAQYQRIVDYVRDRTPNVNLRGEKQKQLKRGLWAAQKLKDEDSISLFSA